MSLQLIFVGNKGGTNIAWSFVRASERLAITYHFCDATTAYHPKSIYSRLHWRLNDHRPISLNSFSASVAAHCETQRPHALIATGIAPLLAQDLKRIHNANVTTAIYLTDDPFNPNHKANWFLESLPHYCFVFTPRLTTTPDLTTIGTKNIIYCPFAYDDTIFKPAHNQDTIEPRYDVFFAGGADTQQLRSISALLHSGITVSLHGDYWNRFPITSKICRGHIEASSIPHTAAQCRIALCLVRKANRDTHSMRSYELPAMRLCILAEDTSDHRTMFGNDGDAALYFTDHNDVATKAQLLLQDHQLRTRLANTAHSIITNQSNTYVDRLQFILSHLSQ